MNHVFVTREKELQQLENRLEKTLAGQGQVCFVTGEAGMGKTSLTAEFARRAQERNADLLVVIGDCNAQTGIGDPYLPFREAMAMLAGDIDDRVAQGITTEENASRLKGFLQVSKRIITDIGPDLIDIFLPGAGLATRAGAVVMRDRDSRDRLGSTLSRSSASLSVADASRESEQKRIFEQVTTVLTALSRQKPLVLVFDDLHWVDESSASLLFHLARRIEGSRIQIIGSYRPEEVAARRGDARHPMIQVVSEIKRHYGDPFIVLGDETADESRAFVDALIDSEPNRLDEDFRRELHSHTSGHPLFTAELLLDMQERGDLVPGADGAWEAGASLDWHLLPHRVEGVIEERIGRLEEELRDILMVASVEGVTFTAQVISRLHEIAERHLLKRLTHELDRQHRLVREESRGRVGDRRISQFRFYHQMFQKYLYESLGESEREQLHEDVAAVLEALYLESQEKIAVQLARHYTCAGITDKAASCFLVAAEHAVSIHAYSEALALADRGLECMNALGDVSAHSDELLELNLLRGEAQHHLGLFTESMETFRLTAELAAKLGAAEPLARAALGYDEPRWRCNLLETTAVSLLTQALEALDDEDSVLRVLLIAHLARASLGTAPPDQLMQMLNGAVAMARRLGDARALIEALRTRLNLDRAPAGIHDRLRLLDEMLETVESIDDKHLQMELLAFRIYDQAAIGNTEGWAADLEKHRSIIEEFAEPFYVYSQHSLAVAPGILAGDFDAAEADAMRAFQVGQKLGVDNTEGVMGVQMFTIRREQGRLAEIAPVVRHFVDEHGRGAAWRPGLAIIYAEIGEVDKARAEFDRLATDRFSAIPRDSLWQTSLTYLADVCCAVDDTDNGQLLYDLLLPYRDLTVVVGNAIVCLGATSRFLGQLAFMLGRWQEAGEHFRHAVEMNARIGADPWLAHAQYHYGRMLRQRGNADEVRLASDLAEAALETARRLNMRGLESKLVAAAGH